MLIRGIEQEPIDNAHSSEKHWNRLPEHYRQEVPTNQNEQKCSLRAETPSWVYPRGHQSRETKGQQHVVRRLQHDVSHVNAQFTDASTTKIVQANDIIQLEGRQIDIFKLSVDECQDSVDRKYWKLHSEEAARARKGERQKAQTPSQLYPMPQGQGPKCSFGPRFFTILSLPHETSLECATDSSETPLDDEPFIKLLVA